MTTLTRLATISPVSRLISHLRTPLYRNGYALVFSSATTSALGLVYWVLAARNYPAEAVGLNSAAMSAMIFLANVAQLNLMNALNRFIPTAGRATSRLVVSAYLISLGMALLASLIFLVGIGVWSPTLGFLNSSPLSMLWFTCATMAWCIFVLQDSVLIGLRQATWVPIENIVFAVVKIGLLVGLATLMPLYGVFVSWTIPVVILLLPFNLLIFRHLIPRHVQATVAQAEPVVPGQIARYVAGNYFASLIWMATTNLLPLIVVERAGAAANAYFYLAWTIAYSLELVSRNMGMSLITEAATDQAKLDLYSFRTFVQTARLLVPVVALIMLGAPYLLLLFGQSYAAEGVTLLRLLCLASLPNIVISIYMSIARVQRRLTELVVVLTSLCVLILSLSYFLLERYGITGIGLAWLLSQTLVATVLALTRLRTAWAPHLNIQPLLRLLAIPRQQWWQWRHRPDLAKAAKLAAELLPQISAPANLPPPASWRTQRPIQTVTDMIVVPLGPSGQPAVGLLKLPQSNAAMLSLQHQVTVLKKLQADARLGEWRAFLPALLAEGQAAGQVYEVEQMLPGIEASHLLAEPTACQRLQAVAAIVIGGLHQRTATLVVADEERLQRWIHEPIAVIRRLKETKANSAGAEPALDRLAVELQRALAGRALAVSWVHGDFAPGNILVTPDGATVTGIVDWELAAPDDLPQLDLVQLLLSTRMAVHQRELGDVVRELLDGADWLPHERALLEAAQSALPGEALRQRELVLLCWLRHITANLTKSTRYAGHWLWRSKNIEAILRYL